MKKYPYLIKENQQILIKKFAIQIKFCDLKFHVRQTPEEGRRIYQPKRGGNNNKDEDNSPKTLNDKNHQTSSQKFRQLSFM